jgi:histone arginine demethylase JMJD6
MRRQIDAKRGNFAMPSNADLPATLSFRDVERIPASALSYSEFLERFAMAKTPVIITGLAQAMTTVPWTLEHVVAVAGQRRVMLKQRVHGSCEWARLEDACEATLAEFVQGIEGRFHDKYVFDWSLPQSCPELASEVIIPKYFSGDYLQGAAPGSLYRDSWPSLFVAPRGLVSDLHVDTFGSNFWMALFSGRKQWTFFPAEETRLLYPSFAASMDPVFDVDVLAPDFRRHPLLADTHPFRCVLEAGEVLFVPAGCAHHVVNITDSLAISANFVDDSNLALVRDELRIDALQSERARELLDQLRGVESRHPIRPEAQQDLPFAEFKRARDSGVM